MAGLSRSYDTTKIELGPGDLWLGAELPATGSRPVIAAAADGALTPDGTASVGAIHVGLFLEGGAKVSIKSETQDYMADQPTAPVLSTITGEPSELSGTMIQLLDFATVLKILAGGTRTTGSGYDQITWGGKQTVATFTALLIAPIYNDPTKVLCVELYKAYCVSGLEFEIARNKMASVPFTLRGLAIASRPSGDQTGIMFKTT